MYRSSRSVAAELSLPMVTAFSSVSVAANVEYHAQGDDIAAFQFDLEYDQSVLSITATIGNAAAAAGKGLTTAVLPNGRLRLLIFGLNQNVIPDWQHS